MKLTECEIEMLFKNGYNNGEFKLTQESISRFVHERIRDVNEELYGSRSIISERAIYIVDQGFRMFFKKLKVEREKETRGVPITLVVRTLSELEKQKRNTYIRKYIKGKVS